MESAHAEGPCSFEEFLRKEVGRIAEARRKVGEIRSAAGEYAEGVEDVCKAGRSLGALEGYSLIRAAARSHRNLSRAGKVFEKVKYLNKRVDGLESEIRALIEEKSTKQLLGAYEGVVEVEEVCLEMGEEGAAKGGRRQEAGRSERARELFELLFFTLVDDLPDVLGREGAPAALKVLKVVQAEEKRDEKTRRAIEARHKGHREQHGHCEVYRIYERRGITRLRERMYETLLGSIEGKFAREVERDGRFSNDPRVQEREYLSPHHLDFILEDLSALALTRELGLPSHFELFNFACIHYHRNLYESLERKAAFMDPNEALGVMEWVELYYDTMEKQFGKSPGSLGPRLLLEHEEELAQKYVSAAGEKLKKWIGNLAEMEAERFVQRSKTPDLDPENKFISMGFIDLLQIIKQQIDPVAFHEALFDKIMEHVAESVEGFKRAMFKVMDKELALFCREKGNPGFEEYCIALGNSSLKFMDCLSELSVYSRPKVQELGSSFFEFLDKTTESLVFLVLETVRPVTRNLFRDKWYREPIVETAVATFADYAADYQASMLEYSFEAFVQALLEGFVVKYLERIVNKKSALRAESISRILQDKKQLSVFFGKFLPDSHVSLSFRPLEFVLSILNCENPSLIVLEINSLLAAYPETTPEFVRKLLSRKAGVSSEEAAAIVKKCAWPPRKVKKGGAFSSVLSK